MCSQVSTRLGRSTYSVLVQAVLSHVYTDASPSAQKIPNTTDGATAVPGIPLTSTHFRPVMWSDGFFLFVAVTAGDQVWLWQEAGLSLIPSGWNFWGSLPPDAGSNKIIEGLVAIDKGGVRTLAAFRNKRLWIREAGTGAQWVSLNFSIGANEAIELIAPVGSDTPVNLSDTLLAVAKDETTSQRSLYTVTSSGVTKKLLSGVTKDVVPFGIKRVTSNRLEVIAAQGTLDTLLAWKTGNITSFVSLDSGVLITGVDTFIDGRIESGEIAVYCLANNLGSPELLTWTPFDPNLENIVFHNPSDPLVGTPKAGITLFGDRVYVPGSNEGEIISAVLGARQRYLAVASTFFFCIGDPASGVSARKG